MLRFLALAVSLTLTGCGIDRTIDPATVEELDTLADFRRISIKSQLQIAPPDEPGEKLIICLTLRRKNDQSPIRNHRMQFYHTNIQGEYQPEYANDESSARLSGWATTDGEGRIFVETILPGDYGSSADNRHIHTTLHSADPKGYDIHFKQYSSRMSKNFIAGSDQHFLANLKRTTDGSLVAYVNIEAKRVQ